MAQERRLAELEFLDELFSKLSVALDVVLLGCHRCRFTKARQIRNYDTKVGQSGDDIVQPMMVAAKAVYHHDGFFLLRIKNPVMCIAVIDTDMVCFGTTHGGYYSSEYCQVA